MKKIPRLIAIGFAAAALIVLLAACGTSHPAKATASNAPVVSNSAPAQAAPAAVPAASTADGTLVSDGYTPVYDLSTAQIVAHGPLAATDITSAAGGTRGSGFSTTTEVVFVLGPAGASITSGGTSALAFQLQARATAGETYSVTAAPDGGDVIRLVIASTSPDTTPPAATAGLTACGGGVYAGADTSCPFALNLAGSYAGPGINDAYSPVTGQTHAMDCTGELPVICTGGNNALVEFYN